MFKLFDSHTHLQSPVFDNDRERVVGRILTDNIGVINVGADKESSVKAIELAKKYPNNMRAAVGCHPHYIEEFNYDFFKNLAQKPEVVAIGECGLDYYFRTEDNESKIKNLQKEVFIKHIKLAKEVDKPLMIHCRDAFQNLIEILQTTKYKLQTNNVLHFFTGTMEDAKQLLGMGFYFTFNGLITFNRDFDEIIKYIPLDKILLETDAPYVAPLSCRGKRNESAHIIETAEKMAEIKGVSLEKTSGQTTKNAIKIFKFFQ